MHGLVFASKAGAPALATGTDNYFRSGREAFFFNERDEASIERAFAAACEHQRSNTVVNPNTHVTTAPALCVWSKPRLFGDWSDVPRIGETEQRMGH